MFLYLGFPHTSWNILADGSSRNRFFHQPNYDIKIAKYADANKQPIAVTEFLTANPTELPHNYPGVAMVRHLAPLRWRVDLWN